MDAVWGLVVSGRQELATGPEGGAADADTMAVDPPVAGAGACGVTGPPKRPVVAPVPKIEPVDGTDPVAGTPNIGVCVVWTLPKSPPGLIHGG